MSNFDKHNKCKMCGAPINSARANCEDCAEAIFFGDNASCCVIVVGCVVVVSLIACAIWMLL